MQAFKALFQTVLPLHFSQIVLSFDFHFKQFGSAAWHCLLSSDGLNPSQQVRQRRSLGLVVAEN
jgi:hypothetical protein